MTVQSTIWSSLTDALLFCNKSSIPHLSNHINAKRDYAIADAVAHVSAQRSLLGAVQNRLEHTINNLDNVLSLRDALLFWNKSSISQLPDDINAKRDPRFTGNPSIMVD